MERGSNLVDFGLELQPLSLEFLAQGRSLYQEEMAREANHHQPDS